MLEKAKNEIRKIKSPQGVGNKQEDAKLILEQSVLFADKVLKKLMSHTLDANIEEIFDSVLDTSGEILLDDGKNKYKMYLDIVEKNYVLDLKNFKNNTQVKNSMIFLLNTVKVLYCPIKDHVKLWSVGRGKTFNGVLQIDLNTNLFIDRNSQKRIGIVLKQY